MKSNILLATLTKAIYIGPTLKAIISCVDTMLYIYFNLFEKSSHVNMHTFIIVDKTIYY